MSEELHFLLSQSLSSEISQEERQQVTEELLTIYQSPQSTLDIIQFLLNEKSYKIRRAASIGLKKSLKNNWDEIIQSEFYEQVKEAMISIYQNESDKLVRHITVQASTPIFQTDANEWSDLFELVTNLTNDKSKHNNIEFSMYLITFFCSYLSPAMIEANLQFFLDLCDFSFETQDTELIDTACGLVANLLLQIDTPEESQIIQPYFAKMLDIYTYSISLPNNNQYAVQIASKISWAFELDEYPVSYDEILIKLFEAVQHDPILAFGPIISFAKACGKKLSNSFEDIIQQALAVATDLFNDDASLEDNTDSMYVLMAIEAISKTMKPRIFFPKLLEMLSTETIQEATISAMTISQVIDASKEAVTKNFSQISQFIFNALQIDNICAKEVALDIIKEVATLFDERENDISNQFMQPILELLDCDQPELIKHALSTLKKLLNCTVINSNLIETTFQSLSKLLDSPNIPTAHVLDAISSLVFSAGDDIAPFVEELFPLIIQTSSIPEDEDPILKANSVEALSNILRFSNLSEDLIDQALSIITKAGETNDYDIRGSVMSSLSNLLTIEMPQLLNYAESIQTLISVYISEELKQENEENSDDDYDDDDDIFSKMNPIQSQVNSLTNALLLIKNIYKLHPQLAPEDPLSWFEFSVSCVESITEDLSVAATLASVYMLLNLTDELDPSEFYVKLKNNFDQGSAVASCSFKAITRFIENSFPLPEEILKFTIEKGKECLSGKLPCQDEEDMPGENSLLTLSMQMNKFFAELITKDPDDFPINLYIDYEQHIGNQDDADEFEISQCIGVLRQLYINSGGENQIKLTSLQKPFIIKAFISTLEICDFSVLPEPLIALKNVLEREGDRISQEIPDILEFIDNLFSCENEYQMHYWSTMTDATSFLCSLMKIDLDNFDLENWLPKILSVLPVKGDEMEAENIYGTILWLISSTPAGPDIIKSFGPELIRIFAQTFGFQDKVFESFKLPNEMVQEIARILLELINNTQDGPELLEKSFDDQLSHDRCQERLESMQRQ